MLDTLVWYPLSEDVEVEAVLVRLDDTDMDDLRGMAEGGYGIGGYVVDDEAGETSGYGIGG